jgi:hypothetical protein
VVSPVETWDGGGLEGSRTTWRHLGSGLPNVPAGDLTCRMTCGDM